jgi:glycosyltransferase involved in cell wall biosynthesis
VRILFVAMAHSIHTARWIRQLRGRGWDLHLFPVERARLHPELEDLTIHDAFACDVAALPPSTRVLPAPMGSAEDGTDTAERLAATLRDLRPDVVHSLELLKAGHLVGRALARVGAARPPWIATNWGSEIALLGRLPQYAAPLREVLQGCDFYACECERDVALARAHGLRGESLPVLPVAGGFDLDALHSVRSPGPASGRRLVLLKGYQGWAGRALVGLRGLERAVDCLEGYRIVVHSADADVALAAHLASQDTGIPFDIAGERPHLEMLALHGRARVSIGLSLGDGISTSLLEAMAMGSFPIQSRSSCAQEWMADGVNALFVHPNDPDEVAAAVRRALTDDGLVDRADELNQRLARERFGASVIGPQAVALYEKAAIRAASAARP